MTQERFKELIIGKTILDVQFHNDAEGNDIVIFDVLNSPTVQITSRVYSDGTGELFLDLIGELP